MTNAKCIALLFRSGRASTIYSNRAALTVTVSRAIFILWQIIFMEIDLRMQYSLWADSHGRHRVELAGAGADKVAGNITYTYTALATP
jgi:hypothetical protein